MLTQCMCPVEAGTAGVAQELALLVVNVADVAETIARPRKRHVTVETLVVLDACVTLLVVLQLTWACERLRTLVAVVGHLGPPRVIAFDVPFEGPPIGQGFPTVLANHLFLLLCAVSKCCVLLEVHLRVILLPAQTAHDG